MKKDKKKNKNKDTASFFKYVSILVILISLITLGLTFYIDLLPLRFFVVIVVLIFIIDFICLKLLNSPKKFRSIVGTFMAITILVINMFIINYEFNTLEFLKKFGYENYNTENYTLYVYNDNEINSIEELNNDLIYYFESESEGLDLAFNKISEKIDVNYEDIKFSELEKNLESEAVLIEDSMMSLFLEEDPLFLNDLKEIYSFKVEYKLDLEDKSVDIIKDSFNVYISGIDSYGKVSSVSRSDVNIVLTVNPKTNTILMTSIPRDYYVTLPQYGEKDKLTHAGLYGVDSSVSSIENLLDIDINYFIKVNFTSLVDIVDSLDGIEINSNYSFTTKDGYYFNKGIQEINGIKALSFTRERSAFAEGDRVRGENQQIVLEAIISKAMSPKIITNYNDLLSSMEGKFITNFTDDDITKFIKNQIDNNYNWTFETANLDGTDASEYTYTYSHSKLYVMQPDEDSVEETKEKINTTFNK